ncbi:hypothetical protein BUE80_DR002003 [Diplocarpon rosae]|nr:hypothetical protein BUE80_DR002003 [Diplocarpon rosae]
MPRPKRTKVAPSVPAPRVRKPTKTAPPIASTPEITKAPFNDLYDVSDNEEEIVASARHARKGKVKGKAVARSLRGAALHSRDSDSKEGGRDEYRPEIGHAASEEPAEESLLPEIDLESSSPAIEAGRKDRNTSAFENSMVAIGNFKRRPRQPSILGRGPGRARSSSLDSNMAEGTGLVSVGKKATSTMLLSNFKRRSRERSIMRQNAGSVAPSSMALEMEEEAIAHGNSAYDGPLNRGEREPSVLRTVQKVRQEQPLDYDDEEEDFNPEDESTPLHLSKTRDLASSSAASSANSRKRKLSAVQAPRSSPPLISPKDVEADETIPATYPSSDEKEREDAESSPEPIQLSIEARSETSEVLSETMAPPQSSSSIPPSPELPLRVQRAPSRGRRPLCDRTPPRTQDSPISSPPSLTHSPNRPAPAFTAPSRKTQRTQRIAPPPSTFSTAQLQALLPRRRTRNAARDPFDIPSSEDEVDVSGLAPGDDELSHLNVYARARHQASVRARTPAPIKKGAKVNKLTPRQKDITAKRTYGAARAVATRDKENDAGVDEEPDPDDSLAPIPDDGDNGNSENSQELEKRVGKELKQAAKKFQEVDKWELEFEDITASSSPSDAR